MGRMLGFGSIVVTTGGVTNKFDFITNPIKFRKAFKSMHKFNKNNLKAFKEIQREYV